MRVVALFTNDLLSVPRGILKAKSAPLASLAAITEFNGVLRDDFKLPPRKAPD